jgi:hypothetical protein
MTRSITTDTSHTLQVREPWHGTRLWMEFLFVHALHDSDRRGLSDFRTQELDSIALSINAPTPVIPTGTDLVRPTLSSPH